MPRLDSSFFARAFGYIVVLIICIPILVVTSLIGYCGSLAGSMFHDKNYGIWFLIAGADFVLMIWLLHKIASTRKKDDALMQDHSSDTSPEPRV